MRPQAAQNLIYETTVALPSERFVGPVEVEVPRHSEHGGRDFEIRAELVATCGPLLNISYPDGEMSRIGDHNERWQSLLALRAQNNESSAESPGESTNAASAELPADPTRALALTPEVAERWALHVSLELYAMNRDGIPHRLAADRCALLGPVSASLSADAQAACQKECAPSTGAPAPADRSGHVAGMSSPVHDHL